MSQTRRRGSVFKKGKFPAIAQGVTLSKQVCGQGREKYLFLSFSKLFRVSFLSAQVLYFSRKRSNGVFNDRFYHQHEIHLLVFVHYNTLVTGLGHLICRCFRDFL